MPKVITEDTVYPGGKVWALALVAEDNPAELRLLAVSLAKVEQRAREDLETLVSDVPGETVMVRIGYKYVLEELIEIPILSGRSKDNDKT